MREPRVAANISIAGANGVSSATHLCASIAEIGSAARVMELLASLPTAGVDAVTLPVRKPLFGEMDRVFDGCAGDGRTVS